MLNNIVFIVYLQNIIILKQQIMFDKFKKSELFILLIVIILIFTSEYYYVVLKNHERAIFIGLWPPTIVGLLIFFNLKLKK